MAKQDDFPTVSVVIPVHTPERPIRRAVESVIGQNSPGTDVVVVCHNTPLSGVRERLLGLDPERYSLLELHDGIPSPAGPLNLGIEASMSAYVTVLGSDDVYEPGVFDFWRKELAEYSPEILVGQFKVEGAGRVLAPAPRVGRFRRLDAAKDLLYTRTPQLAVLFRSDFVRDRDYPGLTPAVRNGEDIALSAFLWSVSRSTQYSRCSDGFLVGDSAADRVTAVPLSVDELLSPVLHTLDQPWMVRLESSQRVALALKLTSNHVLSILRSRIPSGPPGQSDLKSYSNALLRIERLAPGYSGRLTQRDHYLVVALLNEDLDRVQAGLRNSRPLAKYLPQKLRYLFHPGGMLRRAMRLVLVPRFLLPVTLPNREVQT